MRRIMLNLICCVLLLAFPLSAYGAENKEKSSVAITVVVPETEKIQKQAPLPVSTPQPPKQYLYPVGVYESQENGRREIIKVYELGSEEKPENISRESFDREGFLYELTDIVKKETASYNSKEHTETVSLNTDTKDLDTIVKLLAPTKEFKMEDGFIGILSLDITSIEVQTAGTKKSNYSVTAKREYPHLSSNDPSLLPKTINDNGRTLYLSDVSWQTQNAETVDYSELPASYTAVVTYSATASKTTVTGYTTTASYKGTLSKVASGKMQYTAYFIGVPIVSPLADKETVETVETITTIEERSLLSGKPIVQQESSNAKKLEDQSFKDITSELNLDGTLKESIEPIVESNENSNPQPTTTVEEIKQGQSEKLNEQTTEQSTENESDRKLTTPFVLLAIVVASLSGFIYFYIKKRKGGTDKMKKLLGILCIITLTASMPVNAFANNYSFESGADSSTTFGKSTSTDNPVPQNPETENIRRNKDAAFLPPRYGVFSGNIPTEPSSPYHDNSKPHSGITGNTAPGGYSTGTASDIDTTGGTVSAMTGDYGGGLTASSIDGILPSTSIFTPEVINTVPMYYDDGTIGNLSIPKLKLSVKVFEGETLDNMKKGVGHFEQTSVWDGTVGFAGHNRGSADYFKGVKNLAVGDTLTYTTKYGTRTYEVFSKEQISDTDYSSLAWANENVAVLITCVENSPTMRWSVMAREVK